MSDGGFFPWKMQKIWTRGPAANYAGLAKPLPPPPAGMCWHQEKGTREWRLCSLPNEEPVQQLQQQQQQDESEEPELLTEEQHDDDDDEKHEHPQQQHHPVEEVLLVNRNIDSTEKSSDSSDGVNINNNNSSNNEEEWELLSDKLSTGSSARQPGYKNKALFVVGGGGALGGPQPQQQQQQPLLTRAAGSVRSISSQGSRKSSFKIQRTASNSTIDSQEQYHGQAPSPSGVKGILGVDYVEHVILPTDTLQGICLAYKISSTRLRQANRFSGSSLVLAPRKLIIPLSKTARNAYSLRVVQDVDSKEYKIHAFLADCPDLSQTEAKAYLELADWVLQDAVHSAKEDLEWERQDGGDTLSSHEVKSGEIRFRKQPNGSLTAFGAGLTPKTSMDDDDDDDD